MGPKKKFRSEMMARTTSIISKIWWKANDAHRRESTECDVFHFFVYNAPQITVAGDLVALLQQEIASVFVGRFRWVCSDFFWEEKPFQWREQIWKWSLGGATIRAGMPEKSFKIWENRCKVCAHHFEHVEASWKKSSTCLLYTSPSPRD